ncbi:uncharacterized protein [Nicotiana tomentosiformis]|uniref:uncharacterized protein n=1 Tax=Nicotiana tomentosiformis TaxID=4098 RepID=UPI00388CC830
MAFAQATETRKLKNRMEHQSSSKTRSTGNFGGSSDGAGGRSAFRGGSSGPSQSFAQSSMGVQSSGPSQGKKGPHQQGRPDRRFQQWRFSCPKCGRIHFGSCFMDLPVCFGCGVRGHILRDCRSSRRIIGRDVAKPANSIATISTTPPARGTPAPTWCGAARDGAQNSGGPRRFYAMRRRRESETSPDVVTSILFVQSHDVYALIDPGSTLSYVTPYVAMESGIELEQLHEPFSVSTSVGESILAARVYRDCVVTLSGRDTVANLIKLRMVDCDVIMGIDWLYSCFAKLDSRTRIVRFQFPNEPVIEWKGDDVVLNGQALADFLVDHPIPNDWEFFDKLPDEDAMVIEIQPSWKMYFDGVAHREGAGAGILFITSQGKVLPYSFTLTQRCSNNVA